MDGMEELDTSSSEDSGFMATYLNRIKRWLLTHSQHLNFFTVLVLASVSINPPACFFPSAVAIDYDCIYRVMLYLDIIYWHLGQYFEVGFSIYLYTLLLFECRSQILCLTLLE